MNSVLIAATALSLLALAPAVQAGEGGSCHFHGRQPATEAIVADCAGQRRDALIKAGKLEASWAGAALAGVELIDGKKGKEWKAAFHNPAVADASKQTLYIFFSHPGNYIAANYTGQ